MQTQHKTEHSRLAHMPISLFAIVMGLAGLTIATQKAEHVWQFTHLFSNILLAVTALTYAVILGFYSLKIIKHKTDVIQEFYHPIRMSFFPASSIGLILLSIATLPVSQNIALVLWTIGSSVQLMFTLIILSHWIHHDQLQIQHSTPAWFIPIVGNILVPVAGVELGMTEISWFFYSIGLIMWLPLQAILLNRFFFHPMMPEKLLPTLFILIAPPAVGFISWLKLHHGELDALAHMLYYFALFITLLMVVQFKHFKKVGFALPWWAYSFPVAAITIASMIMLEKIGGDFFNAISIVLYVLLITLLSLLILKTLIAIKNKKICVPE
ncbi:MAG: SLAC1 anion channel family protein [Thiotrichales bacterium]|jgi:tellurite resistance protein|nr:SLAC1 anion channel family protein [Thiotrichales bacterium]